MLKFKMFVMKQMIMTMAKALTLAVRPAHCRTSWPADKLKRMLHNILADITPNFVGGQAEIDTVRANTKKGGWFSR
jgi:hypothetical protein